MSAISLRYLVLTCVRTRECTGALWNEVNWNEQTWTIPAGRTKGAREHIVPLSTGAMAVLREVEPLRSSEDDFIFSGRNGAAQAPMTLLMLLQRRMGRPVTNHGFRSAFRDWAGDEGDIPRELAAGIGSYHQERHRKGVPPQDGCGTARLGNAGMVRLHIAAGANRDREYRGSSARTRDRRVIF